MNKIRKPQLGTVLGAVALLVSVTANVWPAGAQSGSEQFRVVSKKGDCFGPADPCGWLVKDAVTQADLANNAVGSISITSGAVVADKIATNAVKSRMVSNNGLGPSDIKNVGLKEVKDAFPGLTASASVAIPNGEEAGYRNFGIMDTPTASNVNYDTVTTEGPGTWAPCTMTTGGSPPVRACVKVPATGTYQLSVNAIWEENTTGTRDIYAYRDSGPDCSFSGAEGVVYSANPAADLPTSPDGRVQTLSIPLELQANDCFALGVFNGSDTEIDLDITVSMFLQ